MPYQLQEWVAGRVYCQKIQGTYTIDEARSAGSEIKEWLDSLENEHAIFVVDVSKVSMLPANVIATHNIMKPLFNHSNLMQVIAFGKGDNLVLQFMVNNVASLFQDVSLQLVDNYPQVLEYINKTYPELAGQLPDRPDSS